jgi:hypothetical protein
LGLNFLEGKKLILDCAIGRMKFTRRLIFKVILILIVVFLSLGYRATVKRESISKIYLVNSILIKSDPLKSITFYDISDPLNVSKLGFIEIEGNHDVAVKYNYMYADRFRDLIVFDISNPSLPIVLDTIKNVFRSYYLAWGDPIFFEVFPVIGAKIGFLAVVRVPLRS